MSRILSKEFRYVPVREQGPDYLKRRFAMYRKQMEGGSKPTPPNVTNLKRKSA